MQDRLAECARDDPDEGVRTAAIALVAQQAPLVLLLDDPAVSAAAAQRLVQLGHHADHPAVRQLRMGKASSAQAAAKVAAEAANPGELAALYLGCPEAWRGALLARIRQLGEAGLAALEKHTRNRHKASNRVARAELEQLRTLRKTLDHLCQRAGELTAALGKPNAADPSPRIIHLKKELAHCCGAIQAQANALGEYGLAMPDVRPWLALAQYEEAAPSPAAPATGPGFEDLVAAFEELAAQLATSAPFQTIKAQRDKLTSEWLARADQTQPNKPQHDVFERVSHQYQELADALEHLDGLVTSADTQTPPPQPIREWPQQPEALQKIWRQQRAASRTRRQLERRLRQMHWPDWAQPPATLKELRERIAALQGFEHSALTHQEHLAEALKNTVAQLDACIAEGQLQGAASALDAARKLEKSLPETRSAPHRKAMSRATAQVNELRRWQTFATTPKREQLVQAMSALAETPKQPQDQAANIKSLRRDWNALGNPANAAERALQAKFNQAAERAFAPCRAHFAEQAKIRQHNQEQRQRICEQLEAYAVSVDWRKSDMKAAEQIMRVAREEWRSFHPVDRRKSKALTDQFERLQKQIHAEVKKAWNNNLESKKRLVEAAAALAAGDADIAGKVSEVKRLQQCWREVGFAPQGTEQKLWREFRKQCDLVFAARTEGRSKADRQTAEAVAAAEDICKALEQALEAVAPECSLVHRLRAEFDRLSLPQPRRSRLERRFEELAGAYNQHLLALEQESLCAHLEQLKAWDVEVSRADAEGRQLAPPHPAFRCRGASTVDMETALLRLTLAAEIDAGLPSPPEDAALRLQMRTEALQSKMSRPSERKTPQALAEQWCRIGPKTADCGPLRERFFAALQAMAQPQR